MMDRREFVKRVLSTGLVLMSGVALNGCGGLKRKDMPGFEQSNPNQSTLESTHKAILYYASLAPSGHNCQPWRVRIEAPGIWVVEADFDRELPAVDPHNRELLLSLGAFVENLSLAAGAMGLSSDTEVTAKTFTDRDVVRILLRKGQPTDYPIQRLKLRRTVRHGQEPKELKGSDVNALSKPLGDRLFYFPRGSSHADCIRDAAVENYRIQTQRDDAQQELVRWLRLSDQDARCHYDGLTTEGMEIEGLKGWFVRQFVRPDDFLTARYRQRGIDLTADLAQQGGGWFIVTSPGTTVEDLINTGRRFERMALSARERGIGIHPMTQILEEPQGIEQIIANHSNHIFPQFVLRVGYLEKYPDPVTLRRPVERFVEPSR
jgi:hypothetical protein